MIVHDRDEDCTIVDDTCIVCGVYHGDVCLMCEGRGFHRLGCREDDDSFESVEKT